MSKPGQARVTHKRRKAKEFARTRYSLTAALAASNMGQFRQTVQTLVKQNRLDKLGPKLSRQRRRPTPLIEVLRSAVNPVLKAEMVKVLLLAKADPDCGDHTGLRPIHETDAGPFALRVLVSGEYGIKPNLDAQYSFRVGINYAALHIHAMYGHPEECKILLEAKANIDIRTSDDKFGRTPLEVSSNHPEVIRLLLRDDVPTEKIQNDILNAVEYHNLDLFHVYLDELAKRQCVNDIYTPHWEHKSGTLLHHTITADFMLSMFDSDGKAQRAEQIEKRTAMVRLLLQLGADPNIAAYGQSSRHYVFFEPAIRSSQDENRLSLFKTLISGKYGIAPNLGLRSYGGTLLHYIVDSGELGEVRIVLEAKADVNAVSSTGCTPLMLSVPRGNLDIVRVLLDAKADPNLSGAEFTALTIKPLCHSTTIDKQCRDLVRTTLKSALGEPLSLILPRDPASVVISYLCS